MHVLCSVIICTYKGDEYISRAVCSVINQTEQNIEIIVVDDNGQGSIHQHNTKEALKEYLPRIKYICHEKNKNGSAARNTGIKNSTGLYICFLDDDDLMLPKRVEKCIKKLEDNAQYYGVFTDVLCADEHLVPTHIVKVRKEGNCQREILMNSMFFGTGSNLFLKREAIERIGLFDDRYTRHQDIEYMLRFYRFFKSTYIPEILVVKSKNGINNIPKFVSFYETKRLLFCQFEEEINSLNTKDKEMFYRREYKSLYYSSLISNMDYEHKFNLTPVEKIYIFMNKISFFDTWVFKQINHIRKLLQSPKVKKQLNIEVVEFLRSYSKYD